MDVVLSFEHFVNITNYPNMICNTISQDNNTNVTLLFSKMSNQYESYTNLVSDFKTYAGAPVDNFVSKTNLATKSLLFELNTTETPNAASFLGNGPLCHVIASEFAGNQQSPILTDTSSSTIVPYQNQMLTYNIPIFAPDLKTEVSRIWFLENGKWECMG